LAGTQKEPVNATGNINDLKKKSMRIGGGVLNYGFIGVDSYMRIKDGENPALAVGKAVLTNAAFSLIPGGIVGALAVGAVASAPEVMNQLDVAAGKIDSKKQQFGGNFQETGTQLNMMQNGLGNMQNARMHATRRMANHARNAQKVY
jgi:hypothetical protein